MCADKIEPVGGKTISGSGRAVLLTYATGRINSLKCREGCGSSMHSRCFVCSSKKKTKNDVSWRTKKSRTAYSCRVLEMRIANGISVNTVQLCW